MGACSRCLSASTSTHLVRDGYTVRDDHGEDPNLIRPDGSAVDTWREDYPYDELMSRNEL